MYVGSCINIHGTRYTEISRNKSEILDYARPTLYIQNLQKHGYIVYTELTKTIYGTVLIQLFFTVTFRVIKV